MTVRITESRIPNGYLATELGQATTASPPGGGQYMLVSYLTSPLRTGTLQDYVVFAIGADADEYRWTIEPPGGPPERTETTTIGRLSHQFEITGTHEIRVEVVNGGTVTATLILLQGVVPPDSVLEQRIALEKIDDQTADLLRELRNDFSAYIQSAAGATGPTGVPPRLVTTRIYAESLVRPKRGTKAAEDKIAAGETSHVRDTEVDDKARLYQSGRPIVSESFSASPPMPRSLGPGQVSEPTIATLEGLIEWREGRATGTPGFRIDRKIVRIYNARDFIKLPYPEQIDMFNLARFPKTNILMVAKLLSRLKNRAHRWPNTLQCDGLADHHLVEILGTEYRMGPTETPAASAEAIGIEVLFLVWATDPLMTLIPMDLFP